MGESKYTVGFTATFFLASAVLSIVAVATPEWVVQELHATYHFGITHQCAERAYDDNTEMRCDVPSNFPNAWKATAVLVSIGIILMLLAVVATLWSYVQASKLRVARSLGAIAAVFHSLASLVFPTGFDGEPVGGKMYKLPENAAIGFSYILFVVSVLLIFIGELFALKVMFSAANFV
eukprot:m.35782 g.35782  ORF g.35782 m.35782 type:complete len:178 (+) comp8949_c0_seq1:387-920(+)